MKPRKSLYITFSFSRYSSANFSQFQELPHALHRCVFVISAPALFRCPDLRSPAGQKDIGKRVRGIPALYDLDLRLKVVDQFPDHAQVLSLGSADGRSAVGAGQDAGDGQARQRRPRRGLRQASRPLRRLHRRGADERAGGRRQGGRARAEERRARRAARHQRQRPRDRRPGVLAALRGDREVRHGRSCFIRAQPRDDRLPGRDQIQIRDLQRARLAVRDWRRAARASSSPRSWTPIRSSRSCRIISAA